MEDNTLKELWKAQDAKLERSLKLNLFLIDSMQKDKARSKLDKLARFKMVAVFLGIIWFAFLGLLVYGNNFRNPFFSISVLMILLFNIYACAIYIAQIRTIKKLDYSASVTNTQKQLASLQVSTINVTRILLLQLPFYTTWFYTPQMVIHDRYFQIISFSATLIFTLITIWFYRNITVKNMHKKWLRSFMNIGPEYKSITEASDFLTQIQAFKAS